MNIRVLLVILFFYLSSGNAFAQFREISPQPTGIKAHPALDEMIAAFNSKNYQVSFALANELSGRYPDKSIVYEYKGLSFYMNMQYKDALINLDAGYQMDPYEETLMQNTLMAAVYANDHLKVASIMNDVRYLPWANDKRISFERFSLDMANKFSSKTSYYATVESIKKGQNLLQKEAVSDQQFFEKYVAPILNMKTQDVHAGNGDRLYNLLITLKSKLSEGNFSASHFYYLLGNLSVMSVKENPLLFKKLLPELNAAMAEKSLSVFTKYFLYRQLKRYYDANKDFESIISTSKIIIDEMKDQTTGSAIYYAAYINLTEAYLTNKDFPAAIQRSENIVKWISHIKDQTTKIKGYLIAASSLSYKDKSTAVKLYDEGIAYIKTHGWDKIYLSSFYANKEAHTGGSSLNEQEKTSTNASVLYNNSQKLLTEQKFSEAAIYLQKAKRILETDLNAADSEQQKGILSLYSKVCTQLIGCLAETRQASAILPVVEDIKGYGLAEITSGKGKKRSTLKEIQQVLQPHEALMYFIDISGEIDDGYFISLLVTKEGIQHGFSFAHNSLLPVAYAGFNNEIGKIETGLAKQEFRSPVYTQYSNAAEGKGKVLKQGELGLLIELYRNKLRPDDEEVETNTYNPNPAKGLGLAFYDALLKPFEKELSAKKKIIFSLDGELNYLPMETLVTSDKQYLIQKFDISYITSGTVLTSLRTRKDKTFSKPVLAFGSAHYSDKSSAGYPLKSQADIERIRLKVSENISRGLHLDEAFATFAPKAPSYLIGTKLEVQKIKQIVPDTDIFLDEKMTENEFKRLNSLGELNKYRVIHISSHAGVNPYVYDLSGIMFSTFPKPVDNEDGELVISEVSKLSMKPELVMLSACQTGLGKLVPGDGVAGLNHAFLSAGSDATITSLWNVSDYATSVLVTRLYYKVFKENKKFDSALCEIKREFISGSEPILALADSWAPFIYTGK